MKNYKLLYLLPILTLLLITTIITISLFENNKSNEVIDTEGINYLESLASRSPAEVLSEISASSIVETTAVILPSDEIIIPTSATESFPSESTTLENITEPSSETDTLQNELQNQIDTLNIDELSPEKLASIHASLDTTVLIGDSMAQAALEYGLLDESHVFFLRGASIGQLTDTITAACNMLPTNIVFFTGLNDTDYYPEINDYITAYLNQIAYIQSLLPNVHIYICSMLPPSDSLAASRPDLARAPLYDDALQYMCTTYNLTYIDTKWMVRQELYMDDQYHMRKDFYNIWLLFIQYIVCS